MPVLRVPPKSFAVSRCGWQDTFDLYRLSKEGYVSGLLWYALLGTVAFIALFLYISFNA